MPKTKNFNILRQRVESDPARRERVEQVMQEMEVVFALSKAREQMRLTQLDMAKALGTTQANVSRMEHQGDLHLSTISRYVEALGGHLEVRAVFPEGSVELIERGEDTKHEAAI